MAGENVKSQILSAFNLYGYSLRSEALKYMQSVLEHLEGNERSEVTAKVLDFIQSQSLSSSLLEKAVLEQAVNDIGGTGNESEIFLKVYDAFSIPAYVYNDDTKKFIPRSIASRKCPSLFGNADSKCNIYVNRHKLIHQRTARHQLFAPCPISSGSNGDGSFALKAVENLLGSSSKQTNVVLLGMLTQLKEGQFYLEDPTGAVKLNLSRASYKGGLFTENSIILAEGYFEDDVFYVLGMGFPPVEAASATLSHFPYLGLSPGTASESYCLSKKLKITEEKHADSMFIFLSDVWLDKLKIMQKLHVLFAGFSQYPPTCFVLIGNFLSASSAGSQSKTLRECFEKLGNMISEFPSLVAKSTFVFVPGPDDPGLPHILPRPPIPESIVPDFLRKVPKAIFTTNPCRIQYCTQEILILREDIISKMCRNCVYMPWRNEEKVDIPDLYVKTATANSHLLPLPLNVAPIYWEFDHTFWLYPLPDIVVCADKGNPYTVSNTGAIFLNPGSLGRTNFSFKVYLPASRQVEDSEISDEHIS